MKKLLVFAILLSGIMGCTLMAGTFRVNNQLADNAGAKIYSDFQEAHDAAYNGDTIMVEGSPVNYTSFNCTKRLVIKGPGYFLDENPGISANKLPASIGGINFGSGSKGSIAMGLDASGVGIADDDITIRRCHICYIAFQYSFNFSNITITECYFPYSCSHAINIYSGIVTNLVVYNCIINNLVSVSEGSTGVFLNNIFNTEQINIPTGFIMKNNILFMAGTGNVNLPSMPDPNISYNLSVSDHFGTDNHNQANVAEGLLFLGALTESTDGKWQLAEGSPAIGAGEGGVDCGAFGGPQPYQLSGLPPGPVIYELHVSGYSTEDNKLPVTIKVKSY